MPGVTLSSDVTADIVQEIETLKGVDGLGMVCKEVLVAEPLYANVSIQGGFMAEQVITYRVHSIKYDADELSELEGLPEEMLIQVKADEEDHEEILSEEITRQTSFCHDGFRYEITH